MRTRWAGGVGVLLCAVLLAGCRAGPEAAPGAGRGAGADAAAVDTTRGALAAAPADTAPDAAGLQASAPDASVPPPPAPPRSAADAGGSAACTQDADCVLTQRRPQDCCATLCVPRAVSQAQHAAEERACQGASEARCPLPACARPRWDFAAACEAGVCTLRRTPTEERARPRQQP